MVTDIIQQAKEKYPLSLYFKGKLSGKEISEIEKTCDVNCPSVFMDGSATFCIRYRNSENFNDES